MANNVSDEELDLLLKPEIFADQPRKWFAWISEKWFEDYKDTTILPLRRQLLRRLLSHYNWKRYLDPSLGVFPNSENLFTYASFYYPIIFATLLELGEEFGMHVNGCGDRAYAAFWLVNVTTEACLPDLQNMVLNCIDQTDDLLFRTCVPLQAQYETILGRLERYLAANTHLSKAWHPIVDHLLLRAYDDRSGIDILLESYLTGGTSVHLLPYKEKQLRYQQLFLSTLRESLDSHAISDIGGVLNVIMSFSWTHSPVAKYELLGCGKIQVLCS